MQSMPHDSKTENSSDLCHDAVLKPEKGLHIRFLLVDTHTCTAKQVNKSRSERGRPIKTMCLGWCHEATGARKERWQADCSSAFRQEKK